MNKKTIFNASFSDMKAYIQGNIRMLRGKFGTKFNTFAALPDYIKEQVLYRESLCGESCKTECQHCGCSTPGKWFSDKQCGANKFPDMMTKKEWDKFKKENNI
jgi:hypothetical protein